MNLQVTTFRGEPRIDSRLIAMDLGNNHKSTIELIEKYEPKFQRFGVLPFQTDKPKAGSAGGGVYGILDRLGDSNNVIGTVSQGGGGPHNNLQPYIVKYMWQRTA